MFFKKINPVYLILGILFLVGIILIIIGNSANDKVIINNKSYYISLIGDKEISIYQGSEYIEPGYMASDSLGANLTNQVVVENPLDKNKVGKYIITYRINDVSVNRIVNVIEKEIGVTYIHLIGDKIIYLDVNQNYVEPGYEVVDSVDGGNLKNKVKVTNDIDTSKGGIYKVNYSVINSSGITSSTQRLVIVMDSDVSLTVDNENYTNNDVNVNIFVNDVYFEYIILPNGEKIFENRYVYSVNQNGEYKFGVYNNKGSGKDYTISIKNINKTKPSGTCFGSYGGGVSSLSISATDDIGILKYVVNGITYTTNNISINGEYKTVLVSIYDKAGNSIDVNCNLTDKNPVITKKPTVKTPSPTPRDGKTLLNVTEGMHRMTNSDFIYYLYFPPKATTNMPIILWLHGDFPREEWTADNQVGRLAYEAGFPAILVAPFGGDDFGYASNPGWYEGGLLPKVKKLLDEVCNTYKCDKSNINVGGHSRGAIGTWQIVNSYPGYFHAASPISCCSSGLKGENFRGVKLWAMRGSGKGQGYNNDDRYSCMQSNVNTVKNYVKAYNYVIKPNKTHGDMANSFDNEYFEFMFSK